MKQPGFFANALRWEADNVVVATDGVGTKAIVVAELGVSYEVLGHDAVAVNINDLICADATPLFFMDYIAMAEEDDERLGEILEGVQLGARIAQVAVVGGETAIMPDMFSNRKYVDVVGTAIGAGYSLWTKPMIDPDKLPYVLGIGSSGIHCNGLTIARKALPESEWPLLLPHTLLYNHLVTALNTAATLYGVAHISGGGFQNLNRVVDNGFGFDLWNVPNAPEVFQRVKANASLEYDECYKRFNMGVGLCLLISPEEVDQACDTAISIGYSARILGRVTNTPGIKINIEGTTFVI